jgi:hypothetical protein
LATLVSASTATSATTTTPVPPKIRSAPSAVGVSDGPPPGPLVDRVAGSFMPTTAATTRA